MSVHLTPRTYRVRDGSVVACIHARRENLSEPLVRAMQDAFNEYVFESSRRTLEQGRTYPQYGPLDAAEFAVAFLAYDVVVGVLVDGAYGDDEEVPVALGDSLRASLADGNSSGANAARSLCGFFYVKPNYPGRSAHLCNAGFVVPTSARGRGLGHVLARSFISTAPRLGYRGSVFNLVYSSNVASLRLWEAHGFNVVGRIPQAGRLRGTDGYDDAFVIYRNFAT